MKKIFVIVLNWNNTKLTKNLLKQIETIDQKGMSLNLVVIDNDSKKESPKPLSQIKSNKYTYHFIQNKENTGYAAGNNVGISYAMKQGADYLFILNNDVTLHKNSLKNLLSSAERTSAGAVTPKIYFQKGYEYHSNRYSKKDLGKVIWAAGGVIDWDNVYANNRGVDLVDQGQFDTEEVVDFGSGAALFLSRDAIEKVKGFDERYFMYFEDVDLAMRLKKEGLKTIYSPSSIVWHQVSQSSGIGSDLNDYFLTRNRILFATLYASLRARLAILRESIRFAVAGRSWQKKGVIDFYTQNFGRGSWTDK